MKPIGEAELEHRNHAMALYQQAHENNAIHPQFRKVYMDDAETAERWFYQCRDAHHAELRKHGISPV